MTGPVLDDAIENERSSIDFKKEGSDYLEPKNFLIKEIHVAEPEESVSHSQG
jgi:hypothetical protein